jgi:hypothetical protein
MGEELCESQLVLIGFTCCATTNISKLGEVVKEESGSGETTLEVILISSKKERIIRNIFT